VIWGRVDDSWVPSSPGLDLVNDEPPFGSLQFTVSTTVEIVLLELDSSKGLGPDSIADSEKLCLRICIASLHG
jgi:hypothetical protein